MIKQHFLKNGSTRSGRPITIKPNIPFSHWLGLESFLAGSLFSYEILLVTDLLKWKRTLDVALVDLVSLLVFLDVAGVDSVLLEVMTDDVACDVIGVSQLRLKDKPSKRKHSL